MKGPADLNTMPLEELSTDIGRLVDLQQEFPVRYLSKGFLDLHGRDKSEFDLETIFPFLYGSTVFCREVISARPS